MKNHILSFFGGWPEKFRKLTSAKKILNIFPEESPQNILRINPQNVLRIVFPKIEGKSSIFELNFEDSQKCLRVNIDDPQDISRLGKILRNILKIFRGSSNFQMF